MIQPLQCAMKRFTLKSASLFSKVMITHKERNEMCMLCTKHMQYIHFFKVKLGHMEIYIPFIHWWLFCASNLLRRRKTPIKKAKQKNSSERCTLYVQEYGAQIVCVYNQIVNNQNRKWMQQMVGPEIFVSLGRLCFGLRRNTQNE